MSYTYILQKKKVRGGKLFLNWQIQISTIFGSCIIDGDPPEHIKHPVNQRGRQARKTKTSDPSSMAFMENK